MKRMDKPQKTFYIYILADNGSFVGYYVAQYRPVSVGTYLTPTYREYQIDYGDHQLGPAPSLDGTYRSTGGDASSYYFFDAETDAYIELNGLNYFVSDQPLNIDAPQLNVQVEQTKNND